MNEIIVFAISMYTLCAVLMGLSATYLIQIDFVVIQDFLLGEGHSKDSALRKINMITNSHFALFLVSAFTLMYWEGIFQWY